jgi:hypothetical protein
MVPQARDQMAKMEKSSCGGPLPSSPLLYRGGGLFLPFAICHLNFEILK